MDERESNGVGPASPDFHAVFEAADTGMQVTDAEGRFLAANQALRRFLDRDAAAITGMRLEEILHPDDREACALMYRQLVREAARIPGASRRLEVRFLCPSGRTVWGTLRLSCAAGQTGDRLVVGAIEELTERRRLEQQLRYRIQHDDLTGMPNRAGLQERLQRLLHAEPADRPFALLFVGIGRLREIGAAFGSRVRDGVIQQAATRLRGVLDDANLVARFDEDTFAVILIDTPEDAVSRVAGHILAVLRSPLDVEGQSLDIDVSVGAALFPDHGDSVEPARRHTSEDASHRGVEPAGRSRTLVRRAEIALETAWQSAGGIAFFDEEQERISRRRSDLSSSLRRAIQRGELVLHYQPKVDVQTRAVTGVEALVRWMNPGYGIVLPDDFVPLAEESGAIKPLTRWVLDEALRQARQWRADGIELPVVVNLSARILHDHYVVDMATDALAGGSIAPGNLGLEVTESAVMLDPGRALVALQRLHDLGVMISLDDFGTGYSSFAYLDQLPATELKIDRSFVCDMVSNPSHFRIVRGTIDIGHDLGLTTVAEGIEDQQTLDALSSLGCDLGQGYYVSPPLPGADVPGWLEAHA